MLLQYSRPRPEDPDEDPQIAMHFWRPRCNVTGLPAEICIRPESRSKSENRTGRVHSKGDVVAVVEPPTPRTSEPRTVVANSVQTNEQEFRGPHNDKMANVSRCPTAEGDQLMAEYHGQVGNLSSRSACR